MARLRLVFLAHCIIAGLVGVQHLLAPRIWTDLAGIAISETTTWRLIGAALVAFAVSSAMAFRARDWASVRIVVAMEVAWSVLGAAVITWGILVENLPPLEWLNVGLLLLFGGAFALLGRNAAATRADVAGNAARPHD